MPTLEGAPATALAAAARAQAQARVVELELPLGAAPFDLEAAVCSHGLFMMAPNRWDPATRALLRPLRLASDRSASLLARVSAHPARPSAALLVSVHGADALSPLDQHCIIVQVQRMLRLSEEDGRAVAEFQAMHAAAREAGFGRIFRSPTLFEDMVKCILLCNCQWTRTLAMATALCELQLELKCSSGIEDFQLRTPPIRERKRKRSKNQKVRVKLETKFTELECLENTRVGTVEDPRVATGTSNDITPLETDENLASLPSVASETGSACDSFDPSELCSSNGPCLEDCIGDFPTPEELVNLDEDVLAKRCNLGYRAKRIVLLARSIVEGKVVMYVWNVLQFHKRASTIKSVHNELHKMYGKYAPFQFLAYWFELWDFYDKQFGKISGMEPFKYKLFTASYLKKGAAR